MSEIQISVILPVYNAQNYIREAIESVLNQTFRNFELIIINDGSTDESSKIIQNFSDERIVFINNSKNSGLIKTLNAGLKLAKGKYIARMDADDISLPDRFQTQLNKFKSNKNIIVVSSDYYLLIGNRLKYSNNFSGSDGLKATLLFAPCFAHPTIMVKNIFSENNLTYDENFPQAEDYKLWMDLSELGEFVNINKPLLKYRSHPNQISNLQNQVQKGKSEILREYYLKKRGFVFSANELLVHHFIGNNIFITSLNQLTEIENWLLSLITQNNNLKTFNQVMFNKVMNKFWYDSCGNSNLGLTAYRLYFGSAIAGLSAVGMKAKIKLFGKCILRKFKK